MTSVNRAHTADTVGHADERMPPRRYRLVVEGDLGPRYVSAFNGMTLCAHDGETDITGVIIDQSHLQGLLTRIASLGLTLLSLAVLEPKTSEADPTGR